MSKTDNKEVAKYWEKLSPPIAHSGRAITLPAEPKDMPPEEAIKALQRKVDDDNQMFEMYEQFDYHPHDVAVAFNTAMTQLYGWASPQASPGFFGERLPTFLSIKVGHGLGDVVQVPMGQFTLPGIEQPVTTTIDCQFGFILYGTAKKKNQKTLLELATRTREILKTDSIYRGKAINLKVDTDGDIMENTPPVFLDVTDITESSLIFDDDLWQQIVVNLLTPIRHTAMCVKHNIPIKRGILLEGKFGTGKSLTARLTASECEKHGWTFILVDKVQALEAAMKMANRYSPAVVFAEDIDRVLAERDDKANNLINTISGVTSPGQQVMLVLTTNHLDKIDPVILRPGRLDAIISLRPPRLEACGKLIRHYAGNLLAHDAVLDEAAAAVAGMIPAAIREIVERAKLAMISRGDTKLAGNDIVVIATNIKNHLALLEPKPEGQTAAEKLAQGLKDVILNGHGEIIEVTGGTTIATKRLAERIAQRVGV